MSAEPARGRGHPHPLAPVCSVYTGGTMTDDAAVLLDLVRRGALMGVDVFGTETCCTHGDECRNAADIPQVPEGVDCPATGFGLCDRFSDHSAGSDCNRAEAFLLRPSDALMTDALRAAIADEGQWADPPSPTRSPTPEEPAP